MLQIYSKIKLSKIVESYLFGETYYPGVYLWKKYFPKFALKL